MINKRGSAWIWIIILVILIIVSGIILYFALSGNDSGFLGGGSSIPQPPALPE